MLYTNSECHKIATGFNKNKRAMQNVKKTYKTLNQQEKIYLIASCWLVVGKENKKNSAMNYKNDR